MKKLLTLLILLTFGLVGFFYVKNDRLPTTNDFIEQAEQIKKTTISRPAKVAVDFLNLSGPDDWQAYCLERGGRFYEEEIEGAPTDMCFVNDGRDGIRCQAKLFYEKKCGHRENAQEAFLSKRGNPAVFTILYSEARLDESGRAVPRKTPLRVESWTFDAPENVITRFENGYFTGEEPTGLNVDLPEHDISPIAFDLNTSQRDVRSLMGSPDCIEAADGGPHELETLKYESTDTRPGGTFVFADKKLIAVTVGIGFSTREDGKLCP